ncbi:MAG: S1 RNA-binding domain-containing protein [Oscillospiraceae bacterium]
MQLEVGSVLEGKVTGITKFGAFVALPGGKSGLVHISEVANTYVNDIHEHLSDGQAVKVKIIGITPEGKINLSIKKVEEAPARENRPPRREERPRQPVSRPAPQSRPAQPAEFYQPKKSNDMNFEDKLKQFMQESDSRMSGNKLYEQQKRSSRRRK